MARRSNDKVGKRHTTACKCSAVAPGFATFASAKPPANVTYTQHVVCNAYLPQREKTKDGREENEKTKKLITSKKLID
ncbi:MAG: hypothetical protein JXA91_04565 [Candidatus Thermoplasmatota archaeon]|nr:hypothetical protein [Candidatus Thermoplasmatota archaeon]